MNEAKTWRSYRVLLITVIIFCAIIVLSPWMMGMWFQHYFRAYLEQFNNQQAFVQLHIDNYQRGWLFSTAQVSIRLNAEGLPHLKKGDQIATSQLSLYHGPLIDYQSFSSGQRWHWGWGMFQGQINLVNHDIASAQRLQWEGVVPFFDTLSLAFRQIPNESEGKSGFYTSQFRGQLAYQWQYIVEALQIALDQIGGEGYHQSQWHAQNGRFYYKLTHQEWQPHWITWHGGKIDQFYWQNQNGQAVTLNGIHWLGRHWRLQQHFDIEQQWQIRDLRWVDADLGQVTLALEISKLKAGDLFRWLENWLMAKRWQRRKFLSKHLLRVTHGSEISLEGWFLDNKARVKARLQYAQNERVSNESLTWLAWLKLGKFDLRLTLPKQWVVNRLQKSNIAIPQVVNGSPSQAGSMPAILAKDALPMWLSWAFVHQYFTLQHGQYKTHVQYNGQQWLVNGEPLSSS